MAQIHLLLTVDSPYLELTPQISVWFLCLENLTRTLVSQITALALHMLSNLHLRLTISLLYYQFQIPFTLN